MPKPPAPHTSHPKAPEKLGRSPGEVSREPLPALPSAPRWLPSPARAGYLPPQKHPQNTLTPSEPADPRSCLGTAGGTLPSPPWVAVLCVQGQAEQGG